MNRSVTLPADGGGVRLAPVEWKRPRRHRAVARALVVQRRSLVWPVTASARGRSFLADPGTCRAGPAAPLGVPATARRLLPLSPVAPLLFASLMPAAAADPSASLQGGLVREAAVGRRRRECCFAKGVGCPILASLFERAEGWLQVGSNVNRVGDAP
jgi:hypothetical protein